MEYMPVGFLVTGLLRLKLTGLKAGTILPTAILISFALAGLDEFHQSFIPGRNSSFGDAVADGIGATLGSSVAIWFLRIFRAGTASVKKQ